MEVICGSSGRQRACFCRNSFTHKQLLIDLKKPTAITEVRFTSHALKKVRLEGFEARTATSFKVITETEFKKSDKLQDEEKEWVSPGQSLYFLKVVLLSGYEDFGN
eukprot:TRINITY_DN1815_c0_g2_i5.p1 TRINITY_DN1815_c0_g2~~TRINITY_DN1815_c0_g2_i5.p1  ORF type:complete len:106 (-),score=7.12 TRINITY_DN1815_c0_g2_i5:67-384(-)